MVTVYYTQSVYNIPFSISSLASYTFHVSYSNSSLTRFVCVPMCVYTPRGREVNVHEYGMQDSVHYNNVIFAQA